MKIDQIKYFISVYERGSFSGAAKERFVSTQAVSKSIAELERETDAPLFVRQSRGVKPTPFGERFYMKAKEAVQAFEELEMLAKNADAVTAPPILKLGLLSPDFQKSDEALRKIDQFITHGISIETHTNMANSLDAFTRLNAGEFDALITVGSVSEENLECITIGVVPVGIVMSRTHPLAEKDVLTLEDISKYPLASSKEHAHFDDATVNILRKRGVTSPNMYIEDMVDFYEFTQSEDGLAVTAIIPALNFIPERSVSKLLEKSEALTVPICLAYYKGRKTAAVAKMEQYLSNALTLFR